LGVLAVAFFALVLFAWWACTCRRRRQNKRIQRELDGVDVGKYWSIDAAGITTGLDGAPAATTALDVPVIVGGQGSGSRGAGARESARLRGVRAAPALLHRLPCHLPRLLLRRSQPARSAVARVAG